MQHCSGVLATAVLLYLLQVESIEVVYQLLRVVPRFSRAGGSSSGRLGAMGTLTDDVVQFSSERATWRRR